MKEHHQQSMIFLFIVKTQNKQNLKKQTNIGKETKENLSELVGLRYFLPNQFGVLFSLKNLKNK